MLAFYLWACLESRISDPSPTQLQLASQHLRWYVSTLKFEIHCSTNKLSPHIRNLKSGWVWQSKASTPWNTLTGGTGLDGCYAGAPYTLFQPILTTCERGTIDSSHYRWGHGGAEEVSGLAQGHTASKQWINWREDKDTTPYWAGHRLFLRKNPGWMSTQERVYEGETEFLSLSFLICNVKTAITPFPIPLDSKKSPSGLMYMKLLENCKFINL